MKKVLSILLVLTIAFLVCSCAKKQASNNSGESVTITWLMCGDKQTDQIAVNEKINEITVPAINAKLDIQYIDMGSYEERMRMNMTSQNNAYDMCFVGFVNDYVEAAKNGSLLDITDKLEEHKALKDSIPDYFWDGSKYKDRIYAVPNQQVAATAMGIFVKQDLADEYGLNLDDIKYLNDIEPFLKWVKENHPEVYPFRTGQMGAFKGVTEKYTITTGVAAEFNKETNEVTVKANIDYPDYQLKDELLSDWYKKGYIRQDDAIVTDDTQDYNAGKYACWMLTYKPGVEAEIYTSKKIKAYGKQLTEPYQAGLIGSSTMMGINVNSKNQDKALDMIELIQTNKELYNLICFGIKDKHYKIVDDRIVSDNQAGYLPTMTWRFGNQFNAELTEGQPDGVWELTKKMNDDAYKSPLIGFVFDSSAVRTEIAQLQTVASRYQGIWRSTEDINDEYYKNLKQEYMKAGLERVVAEAQKQVDEYIKNNK